VLYRLGFGTTSEGYLRVVGMAKGASPVSTVHVDDNLFARVVVVSGIPMPKAVELVNAARRAYDEGVLVSCEDIDLTEEQLERLCLMRSLECGFRYSSLNGGPRPRTSSRMK
jgi:hypothetical protein